MYDSHCERNSASSCAVLMPGGGGGVLSQKVFMPMEMLNQKVLMPPPPPGQNEVINTSPYSICMCQQRYDAMYDCVTSYTAVHISAPLSARPVID